MRKVVFGAVCVLFMQLFGPSVTVDVAQAQYFKGEPFQEYPRPMEAPFASWQDADNQDTSLLRYKGEVLLVNFWATWCGPCAIEMPDLDELQKKYKAAGLKVLAISIDEGGPEVVKEYYKKNGYEHLEIFNDKDSSSAQAFNVRSLPMSFLIDHEGQVVAVVNGFARWDKEDMQDVIQKQLRKRAASLQESNTPFGDGRRVLGVQ